MIYFISDYSIGAHPKILMALLETNDEHHDGYGLDEHCEKAAEKIKALTARPDAEVFFITGGTPANVTTIAASLRPFEGVVSARSGHIYRHETGAVEATGHKIIPYVKEDGKLTPADIESAWAEYEDEHTVIPRLAYISQPTELGTIYSKDELEALRACCDAHGMMLYLDGARLATALTAETTTATIQDIAALTDAFYFGGTKLGLLLGEALVINNPKISDHFRFMIKQKNGMLAKGRLLGVQFEALLEEIPLSDAASDSDKEAGEVESSSISEDSTNLYLQIGKHENSMAKKLADGIRNAGYRFRWEPATNQIFPILPNPLVEKLHEDFMFYDWEKADDTHTVVRFVTNWATKDSEIEALLAAISPETRQ